MTVKLSIWPGKVRLERPITTSGRGGGGHDGLRGQGRKIRLDTGVALVIAARGFDLWITC